MSNKKTFDDLRRIANSEDQFEKGDVDADGLNKACDALMGSLFWSHTAEGPEFWSYVYARLQHFASTCGDDDNA